LESNRGPPVISVCSTS